MRSERLNARIRTESEEVPALVDAHFLASMPFMWNLVTKFGIVDLTFEPSGPTRGFADWNADATSVVVADGLVIRVASLDDIIACKRAADREKDRRALPYLESVRDILNSGDS